MTSAVRKAPAEVNPGYIKVREKYQKFQVDNGVLVHLKGGPVDRILYMITIGICGYGLLLCGKLYFDLSFPKKKA